MGERLNLAVDDGIGDLLTQLAGGERKRGQYLSDLVRGLAQTQRSAGRRCQYTTICGAWRDWPGGRP